MIKTLTSQSASLSSYRRRLFQILALGLGLRLLLAVVLPPGYDESYYLFYGQHLALSYFDHPLAIGLWSWLGNVLGGHLLALRLPALISYTLATAVLAEATRRLFGSTAGLLAAVIASVSPLLLACGGLLVLPDSPLVLLLALLLLWLAHHPLSTALNPSQALRFGLLLGLLSLCKYQALLVILSLVGWKLWQALRQGLPFLREVLLVAAGWLAASSPLWIWNATHQWASFAFHTARTQTPQGFHWDGPPLFLLSQLLLLFPTIGLVLLRGLALNARTSSNPEAVQLLRWIAISQLALFLVLAGRMQVLSSWLVPAWWMLVPLAAAALEPAVVAGRRWLRWFGWGTVLLVPVLALLAASHVRWGIAQRLLPPSVDTSGQLMDPLRLRRTLQAHPGIWRALGDAQVIGSNRYELPGFLALALRGHTRASYTTVASDARGFRFWRGQLDPQATRGVLFAVLGDYGTIGSLNSEGQFPDLQPLGQVAVLRAGQPAAVLEFYRFNPSRHRDLLRPDGSPRS